jgi:hypothetical protein
MASFLLTPILRIEAAASGKIGKKQKIDIRPMFEQLASNPMAAAIAAAITIIIITVLAAGAFARRKYGEFLSGYWAATPDFAASANLQEFQLFIAPSDGPAGYNFQNHHTRKGYLIVVDAKGAPVANQAVEIHVRPAVGAGARSLAAPFRGRLTFSSEAPLALPAELEFAVSAFHGTLTLFDGDKVYAALAKDYATTEVALRAYAEPAE